MKKILLLLALGWSVVLSAQNLYFPPNNSNTWATTDPASLGWRSSEINELYTFLEKQNTKAFILLKDGKIVLEKYFGSFTQDSLWYWASAGKTLTAFTIGVAQQEGHLSLQDKTSKYLGEGWTACPPEKEALITIRHQLTMTSGLNDRVPDHFCTLDTCLQYLADAGTRWAYHNGPYTLLDEVIAKATRQSLNQYVARKVRNVIGMNGSFLKVGYNNLYVSNARSMARFGLLLLARGVWNSQAILSDTAYFRQMTNTSQTLNQSYGYLTWLNGKSSYKIPQLQFNFPGALNPEAPDDMYAAMGKNGQLINVVPSQNLVLIRMGDAPGDGSEVPTEFNNDIWEYLNKLSGATSNRPKVSSSVLPFRLYPNPAHEQLFIDHPEGQAFPLTLYNGMGQVVASFPQPATSFSLASLPAGIYFARIPVNGGMEVRKIVKK